jgi:hypothetical protein
MVALGWEVPERLVRGPLAPDILSLLRRLSPKVWLDDMASGRIAFESVVPTVVVSWLALAGAHWTTVARQRGPRLSQSVLVRVLACTAALGVVFGSAHVPFALDLT